MKAKLLVKHFCPSSYHRFSFFSVPQFFYSCCVYTCTFFCVQRLTSSSSPCGSADHCSVRNEAYQECDVIKTPVCHPTEPHKSLIQIIAVRTNDGNDRNFTVSDLLVHIADREQLISPSYIPPKLITL